MNSELKPKIRFKGFTDDWEQRKLEYFIFDLKSGLSRMLSDSDIGLPVVRANNIFDCKLDLDHDIKYWYRNDPQGADTSNYFIKKNDILINFINSEAKMGTAAIVVNKPKRDTIYTTNILRMRLNDYGNSNFFLAQTLTGKYKDYIKGISKIAVNQASFTTVDFKNFQLNAPKIMEQNKIGDLFRNIDDLITLHQRKCDKLVELKKSLLEKMFPQNNSVIPEIRFKGFTDDWEQRKLSDNLKNIQTGTNLLGSINNLGTPLLKMGNIQRGYFTTDKLEYLKDYSSIEKENIANFGDFFFNTRNTLELVGKGATWFGISGKYAFNSNIARFTFEGINTTFFNYLYNTESLLKQVHSRATGTTSVAAIYPQSLNTIEYMLPSYDEQSKIGNLLLDLDNLITLYQHKHDKLNKIKQSLLNDMFVWEGDSYGWS